MREQRLMAAVDTVEIADGERAGRAAFGIGKTPKNSHDSGLRLVPEVGPGRWYRIPTGLIRRVMR
jgi:hypothetical protein